MKPSTFADLTREVHLINDLILFDMTYGHENYEQEALDFSKHLLATKYWFTRISYANKKKYVLALLLDVRSAWTISLLLKSMWNCRPKDAVMSVSETPMFSVYDQSPMDHNRTAQPQKALAQVMINDRQWFHGLDPESQAMVLSELVTVAGGPVMWEVLRRAQLIYQRYRDEQLRNLLEEIVVADDSKSKSVMSKPNLLSPNKSSAEAGGGGDSARKTLTVTGNGQLDAALSAWNSTIKSLRDSQKLEEVEMTFKDGSKRKIWKVNRSKPEDIETVDFIQMLPAAISKRIMGFLPPSQLGDYAKVNRYWAYLIDELKEEQAAREQLDKNLQKLQELMVKNDTSLDELQTPNFTIAASSFGTSAAPSVRVRRQISASGRASVRSAGAYSFRHMLEKLSPGIRKHRPLRNLAELNERLERRGAADENLWLWCENVLRQCKKGQTEKEEEGVLRFKEMHFPSPLMKKNIEIPLKCPLVKDPSYVVPIIKRKRNISTALVSVPKHEGAKRYSLWSRDFSGLYKVFKVASYQSPV